jgi:uncharacterized protein (DUF697 family)
MALISPADIWRIVKDVDVESIARSAAQRVDVLVASENGKDAARFCAWFAYDSKAHHTSAPPPHPWLSCVDASGGLPELERAPCVAVFVAQAPSLGPALTAVKEHLVRYNVPVVSVFLGVKRASTEAFEGGWGRAWVDDLNADAVAPIATALLRAVNHDAHVALARSFPPLRHAVSMALVEKTAKANATYAFTTGLAESVPLLTAPLAVGDMVVLTKNQLLMSYRIALAHGRNGTPQALISEIVGVLGGGLLMRQAARQLVGLIPVFGLIPKVAVAFGGTWAVGRAMIAWAGEGREVAASALKRYSREGRDRGTIAARALYARSRARARRGIALVRRTHRDPGS